MATKTKRLKDFVDVKPGKWQKPKGSPGPTFPHGRGVPFPTEWGGQEPESPRAPRNRRLPPESPGGKRPGGAQPRKFGPGLIAAATWQPPTGAKPPKPTGPFPKKGGKPVGWWPKKPPAPAGFPNRAGRKKGFTLK